MPHSVYNFAENRYLLSLGIPTDYTFQEVKEYIEQNDL